MKKKIGLSALLIVMSLLSSCGGGNQTSTSGDDLESLGYQYLDTSAPIVATKNTVSYRILSSKNALAENYNDMLIFKNLYDSTNVNVNWDNISESAYAARKNLIMSDKANYPDAIYHAGFSDKEIIQYSTKKVILPIDKYLDNMPNFKAILERRPDIRRILESPDGHIYSLPRVEEMGLLAYPNLLFLNKVWVKDLINSGDIDFLTEEDLKDGLSLSLTDFEKILTLFKTKDMNKNGRNDEIPLSFVFQNWQGNQSDLYAAFGVPENTDHRTIINEKVVFTAVDDKFKEATNYYANWVTKGLIDKEVFSQSQDAFLAKGKASDQRLGSFYWWESETVVKNPEDYICLDPLIGLNGEQYVGVANNPEISKGNFVIFSKTKNPEILLTYIDRFYDPVISAQINYGPIGIVYEEELDDKGMLVQKPIPEGLTADEFRLKNAPLGLIYLSYNEWETVVHMEPRAKLRIERLDQFVKPYVYPGAKPIPPVSYTLAEINKLATIELNLYDYVNQNLTNWLLQGGVSDSAWNNYKAQLNNIGLNEALSIYQAAYDRYKAD
ncbi:TPA: ABC transporter substrate-binding protein [bacterium]|nr:ABC transporter substrate-binding protein [bacterium]